MLKAINPKLSTNNKDITTRLFSATMSNTPLIYIKKRTDNTGDPYNGIPVSIFLCLLSCPSIIN